MSDGTIAQSPNYKQLDRKVRKLQKKLARQVKDSKRRNRTRIQIAKTHNKIADTRKDFLHKLSTKGEYFKYSCVFKTVFPSTHYTDGGGHGGTPPMSV